MQVIFAPLDLNNTNASRMSILERITRTFFSGPFDFTLAKLHCMWWRFPKFCEEVIQAELAAQGPTSFSQILKLAL